MKKFYCIRFEKMQNLDELCSKQCDGCKYMDVLKNIENDLICENISKNKSQNKEKN